MYRSSINKADDELAEVVLPRCDSLSILYDALAAHNDGRVSDGEIFPFHCIINAIFICLHLHTCRLGYFLSDVDVIQQFGSH